MVYVYSVRLSYFNPIFQVNTGYFFLFSDRNFFYLSFSHVGHQFSTAGVGACVSLLDTMLACYCSILNVVNISFYHSLFLQNDEVPMGELLSSKDCIVCSFWGYNFCLDELHLQVEEGVFGRLCIPEPLHYY